MSMRSRRLPCAILVLAASAMAMVKPAMAQTLTGYLIPTNHSFPDFLTAGPDGALWFVEELGIRSDA